MNQKSETIEPNLNMSETPIMRSTGTQNKSQKAPMREVESF